MNQQEISGECWAAKQAIQVALSLVKGVYHSTDDKVYPEIVPICVYVSLVASCAGATLIVVVK